MKERGGVCSGLGVNRLPLRWWCLIKRGWSETIGQPRFKASGLNFAPAPGLGGTMPLGCAIQPRGVAFGGQDKGRPFPRRRPRSRLWAGPALGKKKQPTGATTAKGRHLRYFGPISHMHGSCMVFLGLYFFFAFVVFFLFLFFLLFLALANFF